jgi:hypothetical protein
MQKSADSRTFINRILNFTGRYIDYPSALAGALIMALIVGFINRKFGIWPAFTSAIKQAVYTFFFGGILIRFLYILVLSIRGKIISILISVSVITIVTVVLVYLVHSLKGTPMPFESTLPTAILAPFGFSFLAYRKKTKYIGQ